MELILAILGIILLIVGVVWLVSGTLIGGAVLVAIGLVFLAASRGTTSRL